MGVDVYMDDWLSVGWGAQVVQVREKDKSEGSK